MSRTRPRNAFVVQIALALFGITIAHAADYSRFHDLSAAEQGKIIWNLFENKEWGKPEQKPIVKEILATQMPEEANYISYVDAAITMTEKYKWKEFYSLIRAIHAQPRCPYVNQRAFLSIRLAHDSSVPTEIAMDAKILADGGYYHSTILDRDLNAAVDRLIEQPDHEAVVTYLLTVVVQDSGKGGTQRGHLAAWKVLNSEPPNLVDRELNKSKKSYDPFYNDALEKALLVRRKALSVQHSSQAL